VRWRAARPVLAAVFYVAVAVMLAFLARRIDWRAGFASLRATSTGTLIAAAAVAWASHVVYASFDVLAKRYTRHHLRAGQIMPVTFVCYVFNLNLGAWIGSIGLRYRLYSRLGLGAGVITRIFTFSVVTNWTGYFALAGAVLAAGRVPLPQDWALSAGMLRGLGVLLMGLAAAYVWLCARAKRRTFTVRGNVIELPSLRMALAQMSLAASNWMLMSLVVYVLLHGQVPYPTVVGVLLISAVAGVAAHIPGGLGVLEAVFIALLGPQVPQPQLLAALIGYRTLYFLIPLLVATILLPVVEQRARKARHRDRGGDPGALAAGVRAL
jgi:uncharacterized membrane protein YbhN (UPF0104 family)